MNSARQQDTRTIYRSLLYFSILVIEKVKKSHLKLCQKKKNNLGINLTKEVKELCADNSKTLIKKTEDDSQNWKDIPYCWIGRINIIKMTILPKAIYRFNIIPFKIPLILPQN